MAFKVMVHDMVVLWREIEIPARCPGEKCGADMTVSGALRVHEYQDQSRGAHLKGANERPDDLNYDDDPPEQGDDTVEVEYRCRQCGHEFAVGRFIRHEDSVGLWNDIKELVSIDE